MNALAFACRLISVYSLKHYVLLEKTHKVFDLICQNGGFTFLLICDNLRTNQACFNSYKEKFGNSNVSFCKHLIEKKKHEILDFSYKADHFFKIFAITGRLRKSKDLLKSYNE